MAPTTQLVSVRYSLEVLQYFKATGTDCQTRMNETLLEWVSNRLVRSPIETQMSSPVCLKRGKSIL